MRLVCVYSKVTRLLQNELGGNAFTVRLILCICVPFVSCSLAFSNYVDVFELINNALIYVSTILIFLCITVACDWHYLVIFDECR